MKAAFYEKFGGPIDIVSLQDPEPTEDGVVIQVAASGLCLSDWHGWMGHDPDIGLPHIPGHELSGTVMAVGNKVKKWKEGARVTVPFVGGCGNCEYCLSGNQQVCDHQFQPGFTAWGSFAEYVAIEYADENLVKLPEYMDYVSAASLGCRFITAYHAVKDQGRLQQGQLLAVHGCGGVGLSAIQIAKALEAKVVAIDITDEKCEFAAGLGADYTLNASKVNIVEALKELGHGGVDVSIDAIGRTDTFLNSVKSLKKRGKHIQVGLMTQSHTNPTIPMPLIIANELELLGSHGMQAHKYPEMLSLIREAGIDLGTMVSEMVSINAVPVLLPELNVKAGTGIIVVNSFE